MEVYLLKIGDKWKVDKWVNLKKWISENFKEQSKEIIDELVLRWKQKS